VELHPAIVHFPIALSLTAALQFALSLILRHELLRAVALWNFDLAALAAVAAVLSGIRADETAEAAGISKAAHDLLETHGALGYAAAGILLGVAVLRRLVPSLIQRLAAVYLALMLLAAGLVGVNGYLGGRKVFREGIGVEKSKISIAPNEADAVPSGREPKNGWIRGVDSRD